jgi:4-hydroxy-2-oxoheptanedioate aldolase
MYDCDTVVRIRKRGYVDYFRPLEDGATGIMVPHCMSPQEAELAVYNTKFYPVGRRGMDFTGLSSDYMAAPVDNCVANALKSTFTMVQIEDIEALNCVEDIAAVKGADLLFVGPGDIKQSAKAHGVFSDTFMDEVHERVNSAVNAAGNTWWGTVAGTPEAAKKLYEAGCRFINIRGDFGAVYSGLSSLSTDTKKLLD